MKRLEGAPEVGLPTGTEKESDSEPQNWPGQRRRRRQRGQPQHKQRLTRRVEEHCGVEQGYRTPASWLVK